ncbi:hypothetical protein P9239_00255 [Caballeronia sp. LZ062]|uniref:hypothetical protein n=1 Tax=unclassified Caballeronia TaxID=2646786 RepID=UPI002866F24B|nr:MULTISPECIES: hypothetical protein [unclassified Caballeronia]MDR5856626.1 hypothetical protein [Caballeronia sp. LZ050]MDR5868788.1 hypothetical protein [Caballeronia sp. LZ062]
MPLSQRLVLESLRRRREASVGAVADELDKSRDVTKHVFTTLMKQGYVVQTRKMVVTVGRGREPAMYKWTGKAFPPSSEIAPRADSADYGLPPHIAALVDGMKAMCLVGRAAA